MEYLTLGVECETITVSILSGSILFTCYPPNADIYIIASGGGPPIYTGLKTPNTIYNLPVGNYDYILKLTGFEDFPGIATANANNLTIIDVNLVPIQTTSIIVPIVGISSLGLLLATISRSAIPLTTGKLGGNVVAIRL